jgi:glycosyltransferase involved in cell wall biosynthesis
LARSKTPFPIRLLPLVDWTSRYAEFFFIGGRGWTTVAAVSLAICILAKDEGHNIGNCLDQLAEQTVIKIVDQAIDIHVVANGCSDDTVAAAAAKKAMFGGQVRLHVHDVRQGGKSRAWNRAVHELVGPATELLVFLDADISFVTDKVIASLLERLKAGPQLLACSSFPVKNVEIKPSKNVFDRFSLLVSKRTRHVGVINGQLYVARASALREIWLPDQTPGEDGFLNAMLMTNGFTHPADLSLVVTPEEPTHYFHAHRASEFVSHERRMIVGTIINRWIFEHLWSLELATPAGPLLRDWNEADPGWVDRLVRQKAERKRWLIPGAILFGRFRRSDQRVWWKRAAHVPVAIAATLLTLPPAVLANRRLKEVGAAATW